MPTYTFGTRSGSNRVGFQTRAWSIGNPDINSITPDISGNRRILIVDLQAGLIGQANGSPWVTLGISGNGASVTSGRVSIGNTTQTGNAFTPPLVTFGITNTTVTNVTGAFTLTMSAFVSSGGGGTNGNLENNTTTDDVRIALSGGATQFWGGFVYRMVPTAPTATNLTVSGNSFTFSWTAPSSNGDTAITDYQVEHSANSSFSPATTVTVGAGSTSTTVNGLTGTRFFRVFARNATGSSQRSSALSAATVSPPTWTTTTLNEIARVGSSYSTTVTASGATSYAIGTGSLPPGITLNTSTGVISGTASAGVSQAFSFTVNATNGGGTTTSNSFTLNRRQPLPVWTDNTLNSDLRVGTSYTDSVSANNVSSYTVSGLPSGGLSHSAGTVSGTPTTTSNISFTISANNSDGDFVSQEFTLTPKPRLPVWTDNTLSTTTVRVNQSYTDAVVANNATGYAVHSGSLPPGISLDTVFGGISGTPTTVGTYNFVIRARNAIDERIFTSTLTITVQPAGSGRVWNGAAWVEAPFRVWNGASWAEAPAKVWNGASWVDPTS